MLEDLGRAGGTIGHRGSVQMEGLTWAICMSQVLRSNEAVTTVLLCTYSVLPLSRSHKCLHGSWSRAPDLDKVTGEMLRMI